MELPDIIHDPLAKAAAGLGSIAAVANPDLLLAAFDALLASAPQIFSGVTVGALTLPQVLPPETPAEWVLVGAAVLFVGYLAMQVNDNFEERGL